jgi:hypothetical protein
MDMEFIRKSSQLHPADLLKARAEEEGEVE